MAHRSSSSRRRAARARLAVAALAAVVVLATGPRAFAQQTAAPAAAPLAPEFTLRALDGPNLRLAEQRGRVVLLHFWATWCRDCAAQLAAVSAWQATHGATDLLVLAVNVDEQPARATQVARAQAAGVTVLFDPDKRAIRAYDPAALPATILVDRDGRVRAQTSGRGNHLTALAPQLRELLP